MLRKQGSCHSKISCDGFSMCEIENCIWIWNMSNEIFQQHIILLLFEFCDRGLKEHALSRNGIQDHQNANWSFATREVLLIFFFPGVPLVNVQLQKNIFSVLSSHFMILFNFWKPVNTEVMFGKSLVKVSILESLTPPKEKEIWRSASVSTWWPLCRHSLCLFRHVCLGSAAYTVVWEVPGSCWWWTKT